jgi:hypothetical protein
MTRLRSDLLYVVSALVVMFLALGAYKARDISRYEMWPDFVRWALEFAIVAAFAFVAGYTLAWARRDKKEGA